MAGWQDDKVVAPPAAATPQDAALQPWQRDSIASPSTTPQKPEGVTPDNVMRSLARGASLGFADELAAAGDATAGPAVDWALGKVGLGTSGTSAAPTWSERYTENLAKERAKDTSFDEAHPYVSGAAKLAGGVGGTVAAAPFVPEAVTARAATLPGNIAKQAAVGAAAGGVSGFGEGEGENRLGNAAVGAATGGAFGAVADPVVRAIAGPVRRVLKPTEQGLAAAAEREGITLTPAQVTGSPTLRLAEETMSRMPLANGPMQNAYRAQRQQFNRAVLQRAGISEDNASSAVLEQTFKDAGQKFDDLASRTTLNVDPQFGADVRQVVQDYGRRLPTDVAPVFKSYIDDLEPLLQAAAPGQPGSTLPAARSTASPQISGDTYLRIRSDLTRRIRGSQNNPYLQDALGGLVDALDGAMERSSSPELRQAWQQQRQQYAALMTVDKAMQGGTQESRSAGDIPYGALERAVMQSDRGGFSRGRGQLNELSRIGGFLATRVPNSGTPERNLMTNIMTGGAFGAGVGGGYAAGPAGVAAGVALPYGISRFYNSPIGRRYLTREIGLSPPEYTAILGGQAARPFLPNKEDRSGDAELKRAILSR